MNNFSPGDAVTTPDGTLATFVKYAADGNAIVKIGMDTQFANPNALRKVA